MQSFCPTAKTSPVSRASLVLPQGRDALGGQVLRLPRETEIYPEGSLARDVYKLISGVLRTTKLLGDGRRQIGAFVLPGEWVGFDGRTHHYFGLETVTEASVLVIPRRLLYDRARTEPEIADLVSALLVQSLTSAEERILLLGRKTARERVATFLLDLFRRSDCSLQKPLHVPMSRQDIADYLGLTIETVSRTFSELKRLGVIGMPTAHEVRVRDAAALERLSGEEDRIALAS
jgi:CRP/FNR family nitrogen fixation transcriptional regulator